MLEQKIEALTAAVRENTVVTTTLIEKMGGTIPDLSEVTATTAAPEKTEAEKVEAPVKPKKKRRTKAEIAADKAAAEAKAAAATTDIPPAPVSEAAAAATTTNIPPVPEVDLSQSRDTWAEGVTGADEFTPLIGRMINGVEVPDGVGLGMEAEWYAVHSKVNADAPAQMSKEEARDKLTKFVTTKGGAAIGAAIGMFAAPGKTFDEIPAEKYGDLVAHLEKCPDAGTTPPPPPAG